jgi:hypothetical protein
MSEDKEYERAKRELEEAMAKLIEIQTPNPSIKVEPPLYCSFCGKSVHEVRKLVMGPSVFICDECVAEAQKLLNEER